MRTIRILSPIVVLVFLFAFTCVLSSSASAQAADLASLQSKLTIDCKSIRGHATRIVAEASGQEFNHDVAAAHLSQVAKYQASMEADLKATDKLLTDEQRKIVGAEMAFLLETCKQVGNGVRTLQKEFDSENPNTAAIRKIAGDIRNEMTQGAETHDRLKKKLGII
jgi:hypothetical protein